MSTKLTRLEGELNLFIFCVKLKIVKEKNTI